MIQRGSYAMRLMTRIVGARFEIRLDVHNMGVAVSRSLVGVAPDGIETPKTLFTYDEVDQFIAPLTEAFYHEIDDQDKSLTQMRMRGTAMTYQDDILSATLFTNSTALPSYKRALEWYSIEQQGDIPDSKIAPFVSFVNSMGDD